MIYSILYDCKFVIESDFDFVLGFLRLVLKGSLPSMG